MSWKKKYMEQFVGNFETIINALMIPAFLTSYFLTVFEYHKTGFSWLVLLNALAGTLFLLLLVFRRRLKTEIKLEVIIVMVLFIGFHVLLKSGFSSNGPILLMIASTVAAVFLSNVFGVVTIVFTMIGLYVISLLVLLSIISSDFNGTEWLIQSFTFMILQIVTYFSVSMLKKHLLVNIGKLEESTLHMKGIMSELEQKYDEIKQNEQIIHNLAYFDHLTKLPNSNRLKNHINTRIMEGVSEGKLVIIDVKNFKIFNSIFSNRIGDQILVLLGEMIQKMVSPTVFAARITGNEYAMWFEGAQENEILSMIQKLRDGHFEETSEFIKYKKVDFYASYSIYPIHGQDYDGLYRKATIAMADAREFPDKRISVYNDGLYEKLLHDEQLKLLVEQAIRDNEFIAYYQNKIDLRTGKVCGVEALSRWKSEELGFVLPVTFMPVIEKSNLTIKFSENVIRNVLNDYVRLTQKHGMDLCISINVSPVHVISEGFEAFVINEIRTRKINPASIILEITEEVMIEGVEIINSILQPIKEFGVRISLDDFGSGYSSLNNLSKLAPDELKIDKTFVEQMEDEKVISLLEAIIQLQNVYGFSVVAEGVETKEQLDLLQKMGCNIIQGYYFSMPEELD